MPDVTEKQTICFVGPFPKPVHGQAVATQHFFTLLQNTDCQIIRFDTGGGEGFLGGRILRKLLSFGAAYLWLAVHKDAVAYLSVHARGGMKLTAALAWCARFRNHSIYLHHHTRSHLFPGSVRMEQLCKSAGPEAVHISICDKMSDMVLQASDAAKRVVSFSNVGLVDIPSQVARAKVSNQSRAKVLGHMSNLTLEKGLGRVIEAFAAARNAGLADRLILAGSPATSDARQCIDDALIRFGPDIDWRGSVHGEAKANFFKDIDVFLFPSLYPDETQGIVNLEALAAGVPVLAYDLCCIGRDLDGRAGTAIPADQDFSSATLHFLASLPEDFSSLAYDRYQQLCRSHGEELSRLIEMILERE